MPKWLREATEDDLPGVVDLLEEAAEFAGLTTGENIMQITWSESYAKRLFLLHLKMSGANAWVLDDNSKIDGILLAATFMHPFDDFKVAKESLWYISKASRGNPRVAMEMIRMFESWAKSQGCRYISMVSQAKYPQVSVLYERMGYGSIETSFMKAL